MKSPSDRKQAELVKAVRSRVGFDPQSVGDQGLLRAVCQYMKEHHLFDGDACVGQLLKDELDFESFVESLVVPETWFFRDRHPFRCLQEYATHRWRPSGFGDRLRVLSIPCSTGEEPYSIAMALLDIGLLASQFQVDAADLSRRALKGAADAVYSMASFRGDEAEFPGLCERFLKRRRERFIANDELRGAVRFFHANLVSPTLLEDQPRYHVVLCRNVLIYLNSDARRTALTNLHRLLRPEGLLYVGHVEARIVAGGPFRQYSREYSFAFAPVTITSETGGSPATSRVSSVPCSRQGRTVFASARESVPAATSKADSTLPGGATNRNVKTHPRVTADPAVETNGAATSPVDKLASARIAADAGHLDATISLCREVLEYEPGNAEALCLMGLVSRTRGQTGEAEGFFQKVLYLDPRHEEALVHMMLLAQQQGDEKSAANFRRRAQQAQSQELRR